MLSTLKRIFWLTLSITLCWFILIPGFTALLLSTTSFLPDHGFFSIAFFIIPVLSSLAIGISGFVNAMIISWSWKGNELIATAVGTIIVVVLLLGITPIINADQKEPYKSLFLFEELLSVIFLLIFSLEATRLIQRKRTRKTSEIITKSE